MQQESQCPNCGASCVNEDAPWLSGSCPQCTPQETQSVPANDLSWMGNPDSPSADSQRLVEIFKAETAYQQALNRTSAYWFGLGLVGKICSVEFDLMQDLLAAQLTNVAAGIFVFAAYGAFRRSKMAIYSGLACNYLCLVLPIMAMSIIRGILLVVGIVIAHVAVARGTALKNLREVRDAELRAELPQRFADAA